MQPNAASIPHMIARSLQINSADYTPCKHTGGVEMQEEKYGCLEVKTEQSSCRDYPRSKPGKKLTLTAFPYSPNVTFSLDSNAISTHFLTNQYYSSPDSNHL
jgi:hypothetical protein